MGKVSYIDLPPGYEDLYKKGLQPGDRFQFSRVRIKDLFLSRARVKGITIKSLLLSLAPVWASLTEMEKEAWSDAGSQMGLTGWKMFVNDTAARRRAGISGYATPNNIYQSMVGRILVESPATGFLIEQAHPNTYFVLRKVTGTRSQYSPVPVSEPFGLPLEIAISYKSDLTSAGSGAFAKFYCVVYSNYQGRTIETPLVIDLPLSHDWERLTASLSHVVGAVRGYSAFIEIYNATGNLYFDNVSITHNSENWARDPDCSNVSQSFTRAFFQVSRAWVAPDPIEGADFGSIYFN